MDRFYEMLWKVDHRSVIKQVTSQSGESDELHSIKGNIRVGWWGV